jgi:hypothetical protein
MRVVVTKIHRQKKLSLVLHFGDGFGSDEPPPLVVFVVVDSSCMLLSILYVTAPNADAADTRQTCPFTLDF